MSWGTDRDEINRVARAEEALREAHRQAQDRLAAAVAAARLQRELEERQAEGTEG